MTKIRNLSRLIGRHHDGGVSRCLVMLKEHFLVPQYFRFAFVGNMLRGLSSSVSTEKLSNLDYIFTLSPTMMKPSNKKGIVMKFGNRPNFRTDKLGVNNNFLNNLNG